MSDFLDIWGQSGLSRTASASGRGYVKCPPLVMAKIAATPKQARVLTVMPKTSQRCDWVQQVDPVLHLVHPRRLNRFRHAKDPLHLAGTRLLQELE